MSDIQRVREAGIRKAIIVDDGYDDSPRVSELEGEDAWDAFFDDMYGDSPARIREIFPDFDEQEREDLKLSQKFITALWDERDGIEDLLGGLFDTYEKKQEETKPFLAQAEFVLQSLEIPFEKYGRNFADAATQADLIVIDLFLGIQQGEDERKVTVECLKQAIEGRQGYPLPSIILMSQVPGIDGLAKNFRKDVKLHASAFRHIGKRDLLQEGRLEGLIVGLAAHRSDSQALAAFVESWEFSATSAAKEAANTLRKIDVDDLQHIHEMLLRFEGLNTSSYILDVFDRVLQYEIESNPEVLKAAARLDDVADEPAPLTISNDRDTYALLEQTLFVNPKRRMHASGAEWPISFGDILRLKPEAPVASRIFSGRKDIVLFVASPACDLLRKNGLQTALLVTGELTKIDLSKPSLKINSNTTPILISSTQERFQINWQFGNLQTINLQQARRLLHPQSGNGEVIARLREGPALNLRQQFVSNAGRVGELAPLPRSFCFRASFYFRKENGDIQPISMPDNIDITGNVLIPRDGKYARVIIDSSCENGLTTALLKVNLADVERRSHQCFKPISEQARIRQMFRSGFQAIELPLERPRKAGLLKIDEEQPQKDGAKPKVDLVATIFGSDNREDEIQNASPGVGLIIKIDQEANE